MQKRDLLLVLIFSMFTISFAQEKLYSNMFFNLHISEGGLGVGLNYSKEFTPVLSFTTDIFFSESKDAQEFEIYDYWGNSYVIGKKNRIFVVPLAFGLKYRLFKYDLVENFRPFIMLGVGPTMVITTPYAYEFFRSFRFAQAKYTLGGYLGIGAYFGFNKTNPVGISLRYQFIHFFDEGVENLYGKYRKDLGGLFITLNFGFSL